MVLSSALPQSGQNGGTSFINPQWWQFNTAFLPRMLDLWITMYEEHLLHPDNQPHAEQLSMGA